MALAEDGIQPRGQLPLLRAARRNVRAGDAPLVHVVAALGLEDAGHGAPARLRAPVIDDVEDAALSARGPAIARRHAKGGDVEPRAGHLARHLLEDLRGSPASRTACQSASAV